MVRIGEDNYNMITRGNTRYFVKVGVYRDPDASNDEVMRLADFVMELKKEKDGVIDEWFLSRGGK